MPIKRRNMILQCVWFILTLSFYSFYWFYVTSREMAEYEKRNDEVVLWTVLMFIPFAQFYPMYKQGELYEVLSQHSVDRWVILLLWVFFPPAVWFIIQRHLNRLASTAPGPGSEAAISGAT